MLKYLEGIEFQMKIFLPISLLFFVLSSCSSTNVTASPTTETVLTPTPNLHPTTSPIEPIVTSQPPIIGGQWHYMFYYEPLQKLILVNGGPERGKSSSDPLELWSWDGAQWSLLGADTNGPTWRNFAGAAYDTKLNVLIIHGGGQGRALRFHETWEWDGQTWALRAEGDATPKAIDGVMAYDEAHDQTILFGGGDGNTITNETWSWNGNQWTLLTTEGPASRFAGEMVYDPVSKQILMYGGHYATQSDFQLFSDFWSWNGKSWVEIQMGTPNPGLRVVTEMVFDPESDRLLMFGGAVDTFLTDLWAWDETQWVSLQTNEKPARSGASVAYDPNGNVFIFFGGVDKPGGRALSDTWELNGDTWTCIDGCS